MARTRTFGRTAIDVINDFRSDFEAGKITRFTRRRNVPAMGAGADFHYRDEGQYLRIQEYARDMQRNDMVVGSILDRAVGNIIQTGFEYDPDTGDEKLDRDLKERWREDRCEKRAIDHDHEVTFPTAERLVCLDTFVAGDVFTVLTDEGLLQARESHRCRSPGRSRRRIVHGVQLQENSRRRIAYWFTRHEMDPFYPKQSVKVGDLVSVDAYDEDGNENVLHVYNKKRFSQTRGITALAPIFAPVGMHDDIQFSAMLQRQLVNIFGWIERKTADWMPNEDQDVGDETERWDEETQSMLIDLKPGRIVRPPKGVELEAFEAKVPGGEFFPHVRLILTILGINLGMPLVMALMDASETNFSGYRGAIDQARLGFRNIQNSLVDSFHRPYMQFKIRHWADNDAPLRKKLERAKASPNSKTKPLKHSWRLPSWPYIEPLKDATANAVRLASGQISDRGLAMEMGQDYERTMLQGNADRAAKIRSAMTLAAEINKEMGVDPSAPNAVQWYHIATMTYSDRFSMNMNVSADAAPAGAGRGANEDGND